MMSIDELLHSVSALSQAEKFQLARFVLDQLAQDDDIIIEAPMEREQTFDPHRYFGGAMVSREAIEADLAEIRDGCNDRLSVRHKHADLLQALSVQVRPVQLKPG
jgi:hypothetical protein